jgi:hypothetical protein
MTVNEVKEVAANCALSHGSGTQVPTNDYTSSICQVLIDGHREYFPTADSPNDFDVPVPPVPVPEAPTVPASYTLTLVNQEIFMHFDQLGDVFDDSESSSATHEPDEQLFVVDTSASVLQPRFDHSPVPINLNSAVPAAITFQVTVGAKLTKEFDGEMYNGTVVDTDDGSGLYGIVYEDGDTEDMTIEELRPLLVESPAPNPSSWLADSLAGRQAQAANRLAIQQQPVDIAADHMQANDTSHSEETPAGDTSLLDLLRHEHEVDAGHQHENQLRMAGEISEPDTSEHDDEAPTRRRTRSHQNSVDVSSLFDNEAQVSGSDENSDDDDEFEDADEEDDDDYC